MRVPLDENHEVLEDGSVRDKRTQFIVPAQYRQHSNTGIVLAVGNFVIMGGTRVELDEIVRPGDRVTFGDYNSEMFPMPKDKVLALCDALKVNYFEDPQGLRIVRVQDVRGIETPVSESQAAENRKLKEFRENYFTVERVPNPILDAIATDPQSYAEQDRTQVKGVEVKSE